MRFTVAVGPQPRTTLTTEMNLELEISGEPTEATAMPPMLFDTYTTVEEVAPNGDVHYTFSMEDFRVDGGDIIPELSELSGITGQGVMSPTGEHSDSVLDIPPDVDPDMRSTMEGLSNGFWIAILSQQSQGMLECREI